ncbi:chemotaxis protein CheW [Yangia mangrovi]|uniref:Chemotaxis protein CheW n=1 Tax=Alloyangia mangrovi TaxID=1779329 RepID=A0A2A3JVY6_9RHOB|nr:chemotaxis protein CheW [Alloyangia mangrovi]MCT4371828.1 chemotaxis protein CheW [Alloyangia mangrovi]
MDRSSTVVAFSISDSLFAVEVQNVREILASRQPRRLPNAPKHLLGLIDVRGEAVALVDLRILLGEPPNEDVDARILILTVPDTAGAHLVALRVDRVIAVTMLDNDGQLTSVAEAEMLDWDQRIVVGVGRHEGDLVFLLALSALFDPAMMASLRLAGGARGMAAPCNAVSAN